MTTEIIICATLAAVAVFSAFDARASKREAEEAAVITSAQMNDHLALFHAPEKAKLKPSKTQVKDGVAVFQTWDAHAKKWVTQSVASGVKYRVVNGSEAGK